MPDIETNNSAAALQPVGALLSFTATLALRSWLQSQQRNFLEGHPTSNHEMRRALRLVCRDARVRGHHVERLIVLIKELWSTFGEAADSHLRSRELVDEIIRECVIEFYAMDCDAVTISPRIERAD